MDAKQTQKSKGHLQTAFWRLAVVLFSARMGRGWRLLLVHGLCFARIWLLAESTFAQKAEIRSADRDQELVHDLHSQSQAFTEVRWNVHNSADPRGTIVIWSIDPFETNSGRSREMADAVVNLRVLDSTPSRAWKVSQATDRTDLTAGDRSASVSAICSGYGEATFGLLVTFHSTATTPAAGRYRTKLVGTMTAP